MENQTYFIEFNLVPFFFKPHYTSLALGVFSFLYTVGLISNSIIITVIYNDDQLHTPMYLFLCNLALVDICYTTTTVPNLLYMLLSGDNTVSYIQCFTQMYFYLLAASTEDLLIFIMAYDRYIAICNPLRYHYFLSRKNCLILASGAWILGCFNSLVLTIPVSHMSFCHSNTIHQFFCDIKSLFSISCSEEFYIVVYLDLLVIAVFPAIYILASYIKLIKIILQIKSINDRKKAFSTCSSHLIIVLLYYTTGFSSYMIPRSKYSSVLEPVLTALYGVVTPMINPLIYSLRNKDVNIALLRVLGVKQSIQQ